MKRMLFFFLGIGFSSLGFGQSVTPEVTASAGDHFTGANVQLSWTVGELMTETYVNGSIQLTQGFHQSNLIITTVEDPVDDLQLKAYPNPTTDLVNLEWSEPTNGYTLLLFDITGKELLSKPLLNQAVSQTIDCVNYEAGSYFLHLLNPSGKTIKTFKIIKIK